MNTLYPQKSRKFYQKKIKYCKFDLKVGEKSKGELIFFACCDIIIKEGAVF